MQIVENKFNRFWTLSSIQSIFVFEVKDFNFHTNLRSSFIQVEGFDIKQDVGLNFYFKFIFEFMCNFRNFKRDDFIFLILGVLRVC